jgi:BolA family transcriptional regulator, general stress-responsive regulator
MEKNLASFIKKKIQTNLGVINNSHLHQHHSSSPKNGNSHFQLIVSHKEMQGLSRIQIHKKIYAELKEEMTQFIHALEILINE